MLAFLLTTDAIMALLTLTFLEIILGIDNIVFISIAANKLPVEKRAKATNIGLALATLQRIVLLFFVNFSSVFLNHSIRLIVVGYKST